MKEKKLIREKVWKWFDSQHCGLEKDKRQNIAKMLGDWVLIEKKSSYWKDWNGKGKKELSYGIKMLKNQFLKKNMSHFTRRERNLSTVILGLRLIKN